METVAIIGPKGLPKEFPGTSGIEAYVEHQIPRLLQIGNITCYVRSWATKRNVKEYRGIRLIHLPSINTMFLDTISYSLIASIHASFSRSTIVWYHGIGPAFFAFIPKLFHKRIYVTVHSLDWQRKKWNVVARLFLRVCERLSIALSDTMFVVSNRLKKQYQKTYHKAVIVDKFPIALLPVRRADIIRRKYHLTPNGYVLYLGRVVPEKRIEWLVRACAEIPGIPIVIAGGSSHTDGYEKYLRSFAQKDSVIFTGYVFGEEKAELISNCRLFVLPSQLEGYPVSVVEALGYGKRCLVGDFLKSEYPSAGTLVYYFVSSSYRSFASALKKLTR